MEFKSSANGISFFSSNKLGCPNAFFTRNGGVSEGERSSLNLAFGRGDSDETVLKNLSLCADALGFFSESIVSCPQVHSCDILSVDDSHRGLGYFTKSDLSCDGYVTRTKGVALGVKTADCVPILMSAKGNDGKVFAVAAVHAGWRGSVSGIAPLAVKKLIALGAEEKSIFVAIGPSASSCCYEVGEEVYLAASGNFGRERADKYFVPNGKPSKYMADLKGFNASLICGEGVPYENIDISDMCTVCEERFFYSHRRDGDARGTHLNLVFFE